MSRKQDKRNLLIRLLYYSFIVFIPLLIVIIILETYLKIKKLPEIPFHNVLYPYVSFRPPSNATWHSSKPSPSSRIGEYTVAYTNRDSFRIPFPDYPLFRKKPSNQIRIAIIGGSTVRIGTRYEVTLPGSLKKILKARYPSLNIEVINAGITSAISRQELIFLVSTVIDYQIDLLIVYDGINDSGQMLYYEKRIDYPYNYRVIEKAWESYVRGKKVSLWEEAINRSSILAQFWPTKFGPKKILETVSPQSLVDNIHLRRNYAIAHRNNWEKIRRICKAFDIQPFFILQPTSLYTTFPNGVKTRTQVNPIFDYLYANYLVYEEFKNQTRTFASENPEIRVHDMSSALPANAFYDGAHVYDDINAKIATVLADLINGDIEKIKNPT